MKVREKLVVYNIFDEIYNYINDSYKHDMLTTNLINEITLSIESMLKNKYRNRDIKNFNIHLYQLKNSHGLNHWMNINGSGSDFIYQISIEDLNGESTTELININ